MNRSITFPKRVLASFLAITVSFLYVFGWGLTASADDNTGPIGTNLVVTGYEISGGSDNNNYGFYQDDPDIKANQTGNYLWVSGKLTDASGKPIANKTVKVYSNNSTTSKETDENGVFHARLGGTTFKDGAEFVIYASYTPASKDKDTYEPVQTDLKLLTVVKPNAPELEVQNTGAGKSDGSITVINAVPNTVYGYHTDGSRYDSYTELTEFTETVSGLSKDEYYVRSKARLEETAGGYTLYLASDYATAKVSEEAYKYYTVTLGQTDNASWRGNGNSFELREDTYKSLYITPNDGFIVEDVLVTPEGGAVIEYNGATGEVFVSGITQNITLTPVVTEKNTPANIDVDYEFVPDGNYSEYNPAVRVNYTLTVTDQYGDPAAGARVYFKPDISEVSATLIRETDAEGKASVTHSYALNYDDLRQTEGSWLTQFALDAKFETGLAVQPINVVQQKSSDLVLYMDQLIGPSASDAADGKVINVPKNYEIFTGAVHQGAIDPADGEWIKPTYNETAGYYEFTGLSGGRQYVIRAGESADHESGTFYLASNFADFMMPSPQWRVTVDTVSSQHVSFPVTSTTAEAGGTVYIYVNPEEGYEITAWEVNNPNYVSEVWYSEEYGYVAIEGITGSITLTVTAEKIRYTVTADTESSENVVFDETEFTVEYGGAVTVAVQPEEGHEIDVYTVDDPNGVTGLVSYSAEDGAVHIEGIVGDITLIVKASRNATENTEGSENTNTPKNEDTETPENPEDAEIPESPENTETPDNAEIPENPDNAEAAATPDNTEIPENAVPDEPDTPAKDDTEVIEDDLGDTHTPLGELNAEDANPKTGDRENTNLTISLMIISLAGAAAYKQKNKEEV